MHDAAFVSRLRGASTPRQIAFLLLSLAVLAAGATTLRSGTITVTNGNDSAAWSKRTPMC